MNTNEKPRPDSRLKTLPEERQSEIAEYAVTHTLTETVEWLKANGVETSPGPLSTFLRWQHMRQEMAKSEATIQQMVADAARDAGTTPEKIFALGQKYFAGWALAKQDARAWCQTHQVAVSRARLELALQKYRNQKDATDGSQPPGGLTPETVEKIENLLHLR